MIPSALREIVARWKLDPQLPKACEDEARALSVGTDDPALEDLTGLPFCTIDEPHSKDLDQAVLVEREGSGFRLRYAIADAAWFVRPGSALFDEAVRRGATCYLPGLVVPMLPRRLSEGIVSLNPREDRRALVFDVGLDADGSINRSRIHRGRVHSRAKLSYDGVQAWLDGGDEPSENGGVLESLQAMVELGKARLLQSRARDMINVQRAEVDVQLEGLRFVALSDARNDVERYNEQVSLLCNMIGARLLVEARGPDVQPIFRVHAPPAPARTRDLRDFMRALASEHERPDFVWRSAESLSAYLQRVPDEGPGAAIHRAALRNGGASGYAGEPARHHGVGADAYARFTAPMREVVGVFTHKECWEILLDETGQPDDEELRERVIRAATRARERQRRVDKAVNRLVLDQLLSDGATHRATLLHLSATRALLRLDDPAIELKAYLRHLPRARLEGLRLRMGSDSVRVGDPVAVRALEVDQNHDRWRLSLEPA